MLETTISDVMSHGHQYSSKTKESPEKGGVSWDLHLRDNRVIRMATLAGIHGNCLHLLVEKRPFNIALEDLISLRRVYCNPMCDVRIISLFLGICLGGMAGAVTGFGIAPIAGCLCGFVIGCWRAKPMMYSLESLDERSKVEILHNLRLE